MQCQLMELQFHSKAIANRALNCTINLITIDSHHSSEHREEIVEFDEVDGDSGVAKQRG